MTSAKHKSPRTVVSRSCCTTWKCPSVGQKHDPPKTRKQMMFWPGRNSRTIKTGCATVQTMANSEGRGQRTSGGCFLPSILCLGLRSNSACTSELLLSPPLACAYSKYLLLRECVSERARESAAETLYKYAAATKRPGEVACCRGPNVDRNNKTPGKKVDNIDFCRCVETRHACATVFRTSTKAGEVA